MPEERTDVGSGVNLNITTYAVSVDGLGTHSVPADSVCPSMSSATCSYSYPVPSFSLTSGSLGGRVAAESEVGRGQMCSPSEQNSMK